MLGKCLVGEAREVADVSELYSFGKGGESWGEQGGVCKLDKFCRGCRMVDCSEGEFGWLPQVGIDGGALCGESSGRGWQGWKVEVPEALSCMGLVTREDSGAMEGDGDRGCIKGGNAAMITELPDRNECCWAEGWEDMGCARFSG
jgi:hypothetical protein